YACTLGMVRLVENRQVKHIEGWSPSRARPAQRVDTLPRASGSLGSIRIFVGEAVEPLHPLACVNRSPNMMANWFMADFQSKAARTDLASTLRRASHSSLMAASSLGK